MERAEQSWESHRSELYEVVMSNMTLPSGVVSFKTASYATAVVYSRGYKAVGMAHK